MPELPEVRTVVKFLKTNLTGKTISEFKLFYKPLLVNLKTAVDPSKTVESFKQSLTNQKVENVFAYGKYIIFELENFEMISHLRMEGKWIIEDLETSIYNQNLIEAQFSFVGESKVLRYYDSRRFGTLEIVDKGQWNQLPAIAKLGYEPFDPRLTAQSLHNRIMRSKKAIKTVLLDQTVLLGLGNIYVNEVLFATKINPERKANEVSLEETQAIIDQSVRILNESIAVGGTSIHSFTSGNNEIGHYQDKLQVHGRENQNCFVCGTKIQKIFVNGRGTYFCPECQKNKGCELWKSGKLQHNQ